MKYTPLMLDAATYYAERVLSGDIPAGPLVAGQCERHLRYLAASREDPVGFGYRYVPEMGQIFREWAARLKWVRGKRFSGHPVHLMSWQAFCWDYTLGWLRVDDEGVPIEDERMVSRHYKLVPKGSGKSQESNVVALHFMDHILGDGSDLFLVSPRMGAQSSKQLQHLARMSEQLPGFKSLRPSTEVVTIQNTRNGVEMRPAGMIGQEGAKDGGRAGLTIIDEFASITDSTAFDELVSGGRATEDGALVVFIGTAAKQADGWGWDQYKIARDQVDMERWKDADHEDDPGIFAYLTRLSHDDHVLLREWMKPKRRRCWESADEESRKRAVDLLGDRTPEDALRDAARTVSPSLRVDRNDPGTVLWGPILEDVTKPSRTQSDKIETLRRAFNEWPGENGNWLPIGKWRGLFNEEGPTREDRGRIAYGVYSASARQFVALCVVHLDADPVHVTAKIYGARGGVDDRAKKERRAERYDRWESCGDLEIDGAGDAVTLEALARDVEALHKGHRVVAGFYSQAVVGSKMAEIQNKRASWARKVKAAPPTVAKYDPGAQTLYRLVNEGRLTHCGSLPLDEAVRRMGKREHEQSGGLLPIKQAKRDDVEAGMALVLALSAAAPHLGQKSEPMTRKNYAPSGEGIGRPRYDGRPRAEMGRPR